MKRRLSLGILALVLALGSVLVGQPQKSAKADKAVVRLGYVPVMIFAPIYIGIERGYFDQEGIDVKSTPVAGGSDSVVQLAAGNFDAAVGGLGAGLFNAAHQGLEFRIVAPMHTERPPIASPLVISAKRADEIKSVADLKGKKVAINAKGAATEYWVYAALKKAGLSMNDITLVVFPFAQVPQALEQGAIDAAILGEPYATLQKDQGSIKILADDFVDGITVTYLYMGMPLLKDRPDVAAGFVRAYLRALRDMQGDAWLNKDTAAIIEKYTKVPADVVIRANRPYYDPDGGIPTKDIEELQRYFLDRGVLDYKDSVDMSKYIDESLVKQALDKLGPFTAPTAAATAAK